MYSSYTSYNTTRILATMQQRSKIERWMINRLIMWWIIISGIFGVRTKNVWWGNQEILGVGNRLDNRWTIFCLTNCTVAPIITVLVMAME